MIIEGNIHNVGKEILFVVIDAVALGGVGQAMAKFWVPAAPPFPPGAVPGPVCSASPHMQIQGHAPPG